MFESAIDARYRSLSLPRYCQGDILRDITVPTTKIIEQGNAYKVIDIELPYAVVLTQDCDLEADYKKREAGKTSGILQSVLICPAFPAQDLREGNHLQDLGIEAHRLNADGFRRLKSLQMARYHFLSKDRELQIPDLALDFKLYHTVVRDSLYENKSEAYLATINELFREQLSQRFSNYLGRVGTPELTD